MKFLKTKTTFEGCIYDRLFVLEPHGLEPIDRLYDYYQVAYDLKRMDPIPEIPCELSIRIVLKTIVLLLKDFHFADAMELISINQYMIIHFYYAIFGHSSASMLVKQKRISRVLHLLRNLYDGYFTTYGTFSSPTVLLDYESQFMISAETVFYPWNLDPSPAVIQVDHVQDHVGELCILGESFGDRALLMGAYEKGGILYAEKLAFPFIHFILMDAFQFLNVFENEETKYHFERFSMLIKAIFGKHCKTFYFSEKIPYTHFDEEDHYAHIFENRYLFKELSYCVRK